MKNTTSDKARVIQNIEKTSGLDLRNYREWLQKKSELEAAGIYTGPAPEPRKPKRQQSIPFSALGL